MIAASVKSASWWPMVHTTRFTRQHRNTEPSAVSFLGDLGNGIDRSEDPNGVPMDGAYIVKFPSYITANRRFHSHEELHQFIAGDDAAHPSRMANHFICAFLHDNVDKHNDGLLKLCAKAMGNDIVTLTASERLPKDVQKSTHAPVSDTVLKYRDFRSMPEVNATRQYRGVPPHDLSQRGLPDFRFAQHECGAWSFQSCACHRRGNYAISHHHSVDRSIESSISQPNPVLATNRL